MKRIVTLAIIASNLALVAAARQLTPSQALERALSKDRVDFSLMSRSTTVDETPSYTVEQDGQKMLYVFNRGVDDGFLVVSADDCVDAALLGYCDEGTFDPKNMPDNMRWWLDQYGREIAMASAGRVVQSTEDELDLSHLVAIEPLVATRWNQSAPYNDLCPEIGGKHAPTGCVATAMAQIMKHHQWPVNGVGSHSYKPIGFEEELTFDFSNTTFQWDKMIDSYTSDSDAEAISAVATLMYGCGVAVNMHYTATASGSSGSTAARAFVNYFDYDKSIRVLERDCFGIEEWIDLVYGELEAGCPVMYSGSNDEGTHEFVVDGYRPDGYFHINWGWGGMENGYFLLTALNPEEQGIGGSTGGYNLNQSMVVGIRKPRAGSIILPVFRFESNFAVGQNNVSRPYGQVKVVDRRGIFNESIGELNATMGLKLTAEDGTVSYVESTEKRYLSGQGFLNYYIQAEAFPASGSYTVSPAVKDSIGNWHDCEVSMAKTRELKMTLYKDSIVFSPTKESAVRASNLELLSPIYPGRQCGLRALIENVSSEEFYENVSPVLVVDDQEKGSADAIAVDLLPGDSEEYEWIVSFPSSLSPGNYKLYLVDGNGQDISSGLDVAVEAAPTEATEYTCVSSTPEGNEGVESAPAIEDASNFTATVTINCTAGYFTGIVEGGVFHANGVGIKSVAGGYIGCAAGEEKSVQIGVDDLSPYLSSGQLYYMWAYSEAYGHIGNKMYFTVGAQGIEELGVDDQSLMLWPNPVETSSQLTSDRPIGRVEIYSVSGGVVATIDGGSQTSLQIEASEWTPGLYLVAVTHTDGQRAVVRLLRR